VLIANAFAIFIVLATIDFNYEFGPVPTEIDDVAANRNLASKVAAFAIELAKHIPKATFGISHRVAKRSGT
jgi:hypothetical protein